LTSNLVEKIGSLPAGRIREKDDLRYVQRRPRMATSLFGVR
jgi:hypothetical protein